MKEKRHYMVQLTYQKVYSELEPIRLNIDFEVLGQNKDSNGATWYALDKEVAAPGKSIRGEVAWVVAELSRSSTDHRLPTVFCRVSRIPDVMTAHNRE